MTNPQYSKQNGRGEKLHQTADYGCSDYQHNIIDDMNMINQKCQKVVQTTNRKGRTASNQPEQMIDNELKIIYIFSMGKEWRFRRSIKKYIRGVKEIDKWVGRSSEKYGHAVDKFGRTVKDTHAAGRAIGMDQRGVDREIQKAISRLRKER